MMSDEEIKILDELFEKEQPKMCLEWGSGGSTVYFPKKHHCIQKWYSIEHNRDWATKVRERMDAKVQLIYTSIPKYLSTVADMKIKFDFILVDGLMREECMWVAEDYLNPKGCVILHDSGRPWYWDMIKRWSGKRDELSKGEIPITMSGFAHRGLHKFTK